MENIYRVKETLRINSLTDIKEFHSFICGLETPVVLSRGNFMCEATSLLGIFAMDTSIPFEVEYDIRERTFDEYIAKFKVV